MRLAFPEQAYAAVTAAVPEKVLLPLASNRFGRISAQEEKRLLDAEETVIKRASVATPSEITVKVEVPAEERNLKA